MKKTSFAKSASLCVVAAVSTVVTVAQADTVYNNSTADSNIRFNPGLAEVGDEITLAGTARDITDFTFQYWGQTFSGNEQARLRFYLNNGVASPAGPLTPSTVFYDSGWFNIGATTRSTLVFTDFTTDATTPLTTTLPNSFTWSVQFQGIDLGEGESAGLDLYNPPTVGGNFNEYWENTGPGGWEYRGTNGVPVNFAAQLNAVPEPSMLALGALGGVGALFLRRRFKKA